MKNYFITGIGTNVGKTVVAAIVTEALKANYWKPIQSGDLDNTDTMKVRELVSNTTTFFHDEDYRLSQPLSPHEAARRDGITIDINNIALPVTRNHLVIEGAGGLMVPLNDQHLMIDLIKKLPVEVILVSQHYLGSINHTLLSALALAQYEIPVTGIVFNGNTNESSEQYILQRTGYRLLGRVGHEEEITKATILKYAATFRGAIGG